jgi:hypothetical protein
LVCIAGWLLAEAQALIGYLRERQLWAALAGALALWALAYQPAYTYQLDIGGNQRTLRQQYDTPFLRGFNASEPPSLYDTPTITPYRWAEDRATIVLPGLGGQRWRLAIRAASGRPDGSPIESRWSDGSSTQALSIAAAPQVYYLAAATDMAGDLRLHLETPTLDAPADPRRLGLVVYQVGVEPLAGPYLPAPGLLGLLAGALALLYLLARRLALGPRGALALALAMAAVVAAALATTRMGLALLAPTLVPIGLGCYALGLLGSRIYQHLLAPPLGQPGQPHRPLIVALVMLALALRLGGMLHPYAIFSDARLNTHNLTGVIQGTLLFTEALPSEAGGGEAPYPPGHYLIVAPLQLLIAPGEAALHTLEKLANALADSLVVGLLWHMLRRGGYGERAALLGAALYVLPGPLLKSLSVGEFANVFGQALALPLLAYLALSARRLATPRGLAGLAALLALALLGHLGVTISLAGMLAALGLIWLARPATRPAAGALAIGGLLAGALVALCYYAPLADVLLARVGAPAAATAPRTLADELNLTRVLHVQALLVALGAIGGLAALRPAAWRHAWPQPALGALLLAWWAGTLLSLGLLLFASQGVRWQAFFYPALCLGAGPALARLWACGRAGRLAALTLVVFLLGDGLEFWVHQIYTYLH